jgi:hypothetical protein
MLYVCTEVLRPTRLSLLYSRCAVLYDYHPALDCHLRDRRPQILLVFLFCSILAHGEHLIFWFVRLSVHLSVLCSIIAELTIECQ